MILKQYEYVADYVIAATMNGVDLDEALHTGLGKTSLGQDAQALIYTHTIEAKNWITGLREGFNIYG